MNFRSLAILGVACAGLTGCGTNDTVSSAAAPEPVIVEWVRIRETPPTFVPKGYDPGDGTSATEGEWVVGKETGSHYFIPLYGVGRADYNDVYASLPEPIGGRMATGGEAKEGGFKLPSLPSILPNREKKKQPKERESEEEAS